MSHDTLMTIAIAVFGLILGSATSAIAWRIPRHLSWVHGRSACTSCGTTLTVLDLVPVLSWIVSRGRCRHCGARVSWRYPLTELLCASWALLLFGAVGLNWMYPFLLVWGVLLIALMWIDLDFQLLPDVLTFPGTLLGLAAVLQLPGGAHHALLGVLLGSGPLWLLGWAYLKFRRIEGMGGGDIKLAAMFGVVLGGPLTLLTLLLAATTGSLWGGFLILRGRGTGFTALPFGTLLAPAALIAFLWGEAWVRVYLSLFPRG